MSTASVATSFGQESTRTIPATLGHFNSGEDAWIRRTQSGQSGEQMTNRLAGQWGGVPYKYFGEWTDRIAKGEVPKMEPPRPQGIERNVAITSWDMVHAGQISARPDFVRPAASDGQCQWPVVRLAGILDRQHADPRSQDQQGVVLQDAGDDADMPLSLARRRRHRQADGGFALLGQPATMGHARQ